MADLSLALPELFLLLAGCGVLLADACYGQQKPALAHTLTQVSLVSALPLVLFTSNGVGFYGHLIVDAMATVLKSGILILASLAFLYSHRYLQQSCNHREYYVLGLYAVLGALVLVSAHSFLSIYLGLELLSLPLYAMVAIHNRAHAAEAAMKYFVLGALASGLLLYGISLLYGTTGEIQLDLVRAMATGSGLQQLGISFIVAGIAFKLGAFPFHAWVPDVYDGAPLPVTLFIASVPKLAAFAMAVRLLYEALPSAAWQPMLILLAAGSMLLGNIVALVQTRIQRLFAYSTIAHMGFLLLGVITGTASGFAGAMFYALIYAFSALGVFGLCTLLQRDGETQDLAGLAKQRPWSACLLLILMFSMAGVPPFAGFWAKWFVLREVLQAGHLWLAVLAVSTSIVGAYYYLRIVKLSWFDDPATATPPLLGGIYLTAISTNVLLLLAFGILPGVLMTLCLNAFGA